MKDELKELLQQNKNINRGYRELDWFKEYDKKHYSLENKLIKLNQTYILKMKSKEEWKNDYLIREIIESYGL